MRLCGIDIPYEHQCHEKVASNRIHDLATILSCDNLDIAGKLHSTVADAQGIWKAVQQGQFFDIEKNPIDVATVKQELNALSADLQKIAGVVENTLKSKAGRKHWPEEAPLVHSKRISIPDTIKALNEMSKQFKISAGTL
jgi:hypothetical protein